MILEQYSKHYDFDIIPGTTAYQYSSIAEAFLCATLNKLNCPLYTITVCMCMAFASSYSYIIIAHAC